MITLYFDKYKNFVKRSGVNIYPHISFHNRFQLDWYNDPFALEVLHDIDHIPANVNASNIIMWMLQNHRAPWDICTGSKSILMTHFVDDIGPLLHYMVPNCYKYLFRIAQRKDIKVYSCVEVVFESELWDKYPIEIYSPQFDTVVRDEDGTAMLCAKAMNANLTGFGS